MNLELEKEKKGGTLPSLLWLLMTSDDLKKWLRYYEDAEEYEVCGSIWAEIERRSKEQNTNESFEI